MTLGWPSTQFKAAPGCNYCYLQDLGLTRAKPEVLATPEETLDQLLAHRYYHPELVLALYTCTDALATPVTRAHLIALLDVLSASTVHNPVCLITKCAIPNDVLDCITRSRAAGTAGPGLPQLLRTRPRHRARHRPRLPASELPPPARSRHPGDPLLAAIPATEQHPGCPRAHHVLGHPLRRLHRRGGTKVKPTALNQIAGLWPQLADPHLEAQAADSVWPGRPGSGCTTSRTATPATLSSRPTAAPWPTSWAAPTALAS
ncbi:hypothetical protein MBT84_38050 [Streptomyces sp. MBT84]|nr:hypothetical protein [Streptomyces sp. MBT84]